MGVLRLPRLPTNMQIVDGQGRPIAAFTRFWNEAMQEIEGSIDAVIEAQAAADAASASADAAQAAADSATGAVAGVASLQSLQNSGVDGDTTITSHDQVTAVRVIVSDHTRHYGDGTSIAVTGGAINSLNFGQVYYIYYDDPARAGGAVAYQAATTNTNVLPTDTFPNRHYVGSAVAISSGDPDGMGFPNFWGR